MTSPPPLLSDVLEEADAGESDAGEGSCNDIIYFSACNSAGQVEPRGGMDAGSESVMSDSILSDGLEILRGDAGPAPDPFEELRDAMAAATEECGTLCALRDAVLAASVPNSQDLRGVLAAVCEPIVLGPGLTPATIAESGCDHLGPGLSPSPAAVLLGMAGHQEVDPTKYANGGGLSNGLSRLASNETLYASTFVRDNSDSEEDWDMIFEQGASPEDLTHSESSPGDWGESEEDSKIQALAAALLSPGLTKCPAAQLAELRMARACSACW